jgi:hypothetical protein
VAQAAATAHLQERILALDRGAHLAASARPSAAGELAIENEGGGETLAFPVVSRPGSNRLHARCDVLEEFRGSSARLERVRKSGPCLYELCQGRLTDGVSDYLIARGLGLPNRPYRKV